MEMDFEFFFNHEIFEIWNLIPRINIFYTPTILIIISLFDKKST